MSYNNAMLVLGVETSCDETALALFEGEQPLRGEILSNAILSQATTHAPFGGVVPELASRMHAEGLTLTLKKALEHASKSLEEIDLISVAKGPGLIGSLLAGINFSKGLSLRLDRPLIGVNHVEAHLTAAMLNQEIAFPAIGLIVSGGHTALYLMHSPLDTVRLGQTHDDAVGEAFDKVAKLLGLPYPGGPEIERLASSGDPLAHKLKVGQIKGSKLDFSFSGLKTGALYLIYGQNGAVPKRLKQEEMTLSWQARCDIAASFQHAAFLDLAAKTALAAKEYNCRSIIVGGGVSQNQCLRALIEKRCAATARCYFAPPSLCMDNGAMIAALGLARFRGKEEELCRRELEPEPRLTF